MTFIPAEGKLSDSVGVQLSKSCSTMIRNNLTTNCPTLEEIMFLFADTSDQRMSGQFVYSDGWLHRDTSPYQDNWQFYRFDPTKRFFVDPPPRIADSVKLITIQPRLDEYPLRGQVVTSSSIDVGYGVWVNDSCYNAIIGADDWQVRLGSVIQYLGSDCKINNLDNVKKKSWERTAHDITTSYKYKFDKWVADSLARCGQKVCFYE